jgi:hypothetical protein
MSGPVWVGAEDLEYTQLGGGVVSTDSTKYRASMGSRCALSVTSSFGGNSYWQSILPYSLSSFWFSARLCSSVSTGSSANGDLLAFLDADLNPRLRIVGLGSSMWKMEKVDGAGNATKIGNSFFYPISNQAHILDKLDVHIVDDVTGSIDVYVNGIYVFAFIGDTTTDGVSALCFHRLGPSGISGNVIFWSESWVDTDDTRSKTLVGFDPVANGHANTFDTGSPAVGNINEVTLNDATLNGSSVAAQIDQYTNGAVPSGTLDVIAFVVSARVQKGPSGPSKLALGVRTNGTDYWGSDQAQDIAWGNTQEIFTDNPDTGIPWLKSEIGAAVGFNIGSKSAA